MLEIKTPFVYNDFSSCMIDNLSVSESLLPTNAVRKLVNGVFDSPVGSVSGRAGSTAVGDQQGGQIYGLYNFRDAGSGTSHQLLVTDNAGVTFYLNGATFSSTLSGDTAGLNTEFVTFLDTVARLNGTDQAKSWNGNPASAWVTSGGSLDVDSWPTSKFAVVFNSRIYTAGDISNPDRLYYSSLPSSGSISWTSGNGYIDVNPNDGDNGIVGLGTNGTVLLAFKRNSLYRWDGSSTFANKIISIGTSSHRSIVAHDSGWVYFFGVGKNTVGAYRTTGGYPQKISRTVQRWFEAISPSNYGTVAAFADEDHYYLSVGSVTIDSITYSNAWFVYTISMQGWHIEDRAHSFKVFAPYIDTSGNLTTVGGDSAGNVHTINSGTDDLGTGISAECEFAPLYITTRARTKKIGRITTYATFFQGLKFLLKTDQSDYYEIGDIQNTEHHFGGSDLQRTKDLAKGKRFYPKITVTDSHAPWQFDGFELNEVQDQGFYQ